MRAIPSLIAGSLLVVASPQAPALSQTAVETQEAQPAPDEQPRKAFAIGSQFGQSGFGVSAKLWAQTKPNNRLGIGFALGRPTFVGVTADYNLSNRYAIGAEFSKFRLAATPFGWHLLDVTTWSVVGKYNLFHKTSGATIYGYAGLTSISWKGAVSLLGGGLDLSFYGLSLGVEPTYVAGPVGVGLRVGYVLPLAIRRLQVDDSAVAKAEKVWPIHSGEKVRSAPTFSLRVSTWF